MELNRIQHIAVVGLGSIGRRHVRNLKRLRPELEITLVRSGKGPAWPEQQFAQRVVMTSAEAIRAGAQAAIVSSPAPFHVSQSMEWLKAGKPMLIEKPLSDNTRGLSELKALVETHNIPVLVGYVLRYDQAAQYFYHLLQSKEIGDLLHVCIEWGSYLPDWRPEQDYRKSASASMALGGGVLLELSHEIDYANWFFSPFLEVQASVHYSKTLEINTEDGADLPLKNLEGLPVFLHLDFYRRVPTRQCRLQTTKGELVWDALAQKVCWTSAGGQISEQHFSQSRDDLFLRQLEHFFDYIENNDSPKSSLQDGVEIVKVIEKAKLSNLHGERVTI